MAVKVEIRRDYGSKLTLFIVEKVLFFDISEQ